MGARQKPPSAAGIEHGDLALVAAGRQSGAARVNRIGTALDRGSMPSVTASGGVSNTFTSP